MPWKVCQNLCVLPHQFSVSSHKVLCHIHPVLLYYIGVQYILPHSNLIMFQHLGILFACSTNYNLRLNVFSVKSPPPPHTHTHTHTHTDTHWWTFSPSTSRPKWKTPSPEPKQRCIYTRGEIVEIYLCWNTNPVWKLWNLHSCFWWIRLRTLMDHAHLRRNKNHVLTWRSKETMWLIRIIMFS